MKIRKRLFAALLTLAMIVGLLPLSVFAEGDTSGTKDAGPVRYRAWDEASRSMVEVQAGCPEYTELEAQTAWGTEDNTTWYVLKTSKSIAGRITVSGDVHLILCDGATLIAKAGITVGSPNSLSVYAQSDGERMGALFAETEDGYSAGIGGLHGDMGGSGGAVFVHGGSVSALSKHGAGIGGGHGSKWRSDGGDGGTVTVYGGTVDAKSEYGAGIGGGGGGDDYTDPAHGGMGGTVTVHGGTVSALSKHGAGIGGGFGNLDGGNGGTVTVYGGSVSALSKYGAGIGGGGCHEGGGNSRGGYGKAVTVNGGTVSASSERGAGIGGGYCNGGLGGGGGTVTVNGGTVSASSKDGAGIGGGYGGNGGTHSGDGGTLALGAGVKLYGGSSADPTDLLAAGPTERYEGARYKYMTTVTVSPIPYQAWNGTAVADVDGGCPDYEVVGENTTEFKGGKWYVVGKNVEIADSKRIMVSTTGGPAHLILCDGVTLTAGGGIDVPEGAALNIYGQSGNTGKLVATVPIPENDPLGAKLYAGIGGGADAYCGAIAIHGGNVTAKGGAGGAGIGAGGRGDGGSVVVYGGTVDAAGGDMEEPVIDSVRGRTAGGAGIGGGYQGGDGGTFTIHGGAVTAKGGIGAAGIGGGGGYVPGDDYGTAAAGCCKGGDGAEVTIYGGTVEAKGGSEQFLRYRSIAGGAGIGGGGDYTDNDTGMFQRDGGGGGKGGTFAIHGGTVTATGAAGGAGIGGGASSAFTKGSAGSGGNVTINGGKVTAIGGAGDAGSAEGIGKGRAPSGDTATDGDITLGSGVTLGGTEDGEVWDELTEDTSVRMTTMVSPLVKASISGAQVTLAQTGFTYDGTAKEQEVVSIVLGGRTLRKDIDYTVSYTNNVKAGTATAVVTGKGAFKDETDETFEIAKRPLTVTADSATRAYDGTALTANGFTADGTAGGDRVESAKVDGSQTEVGSSSNEISEAKIINANSEDVTDCYDITYVAGTLTVTEKPVYKAVSGSGGTYTKGSEKPLAFTCKRSADDGTTFSHFTGIKVDGKAVPEKDASGKANWKAKSGSVIIELQPTYLDTLSAGEHKLAVQFDDGEDATATFTVKAKAATATTTTTAPNTGDESNALLWICLMAASLAGILLIRRRTRFI